LPAPLAVSRELHSHIAVVGLTSNEQRPAARWQVQEDVFQPTRAVGEQVAEALDVDGRRNVLVNHLVCHFAYGLSVQELEGELAGVVDYILCAAACGWSGGLKST
jgi:hypothetical protein